MISYIAMFLAVFAVSVFFTCYLQTTKQDKPLQAAFWAALTALTGSVAMANVIGNNIMFIPVVLGSFIGTWLGVRIKDRNVA